MYAGYVYTSKSITTVEVGTSGLSANQNAGYEASIVVI
jgi:hypothetical protein